MSWQTDITTIVRVLINDIDTPYKNGDNKIEQFILVAAYYVVQEINLTNSYSISLSGTITPDPTAINDQTFINFVALKTACLLDHGAFRDKAAMDGLEARCGMANLKISGHSAGFKELISLGPCSAYESLKKEYEFGDSSIVHGIFSPFISDTFDPETLSPGGGDYR